MISESDYYRVHTAMRGCFAAMVRASGARVVRTEPHLVTRAGEEHLRGDLEMSELSSYTNSIISDNSMVNAQQDQYKTVSQQYFGVTNAREQEKVSKYDTRVKREGKIFIPLIHDNFGALGQQALQFVQTCRLTAVANQRIPSRTSHYYFSVPWIQRLSFAIVKNSAAGMLAHLMNITH